MATVRKNRAAPSNVAQLTRQGERPDLCIGSRCHPRPIVPRFHSHDGARRGMLFGGKILVEVFRQDWGGSWDRGDDLALIRVWAGAPTNQRSAPYSEVKYEADTGVRKLHFGWVKVSSNCWNYWKSQPRDADNNSLGPGDSGGSAGPRDYVCGWRITGINSSTECDVKNRCRLWDGLAGAAMRAGPQEPARTSLSPHRRLSRVPRTAQTHRNAKHRTARRFQHREKSPMISGQTGLRGAGALRAVRICAVWDAAAGGRGQLR